MKAKNSENQEQFVLADAAPAKAVVKLAIPYRVTFL